MERTWKSKYYGDIVKYREYNANGEFYRSDDGGPYALFNHHKSWIDIVEFMNALGYEEITEFVARNGFLGISPNSKKPEGLTSAEALLWNANTQDFNRYPYLSNIKINDGCPHEWATYVGFMKTETYCTKCKEIQK